MSAPANSHPSWRADPRTAIQVIVVLLAAILIGSWIQRFLPNPDEVIERPYIVEGTLGEPAEFRLGTVTVTGFKGADQLMSFGQTAQTTGIWLVFDAEFTPKLEPQSITQVALRDSKGREHGGFQSITNACGPVQTNMTARCNLAIEVPTEALEGASLLIPATPMSPSTPDDVIEIDLGIDAARAEQLVADAQPTELAAVTYVEAP